MPLSDVTRAGVLAAVAEFDRLGRPAFLKATGFRPAQAYFLDHDGKLIEAGFDTAEKIAEAGVDALSEVQGIGLKTAERILAAARGETPAEATTEE